jgi:hypothetical protein
MKTIAALTAAALVAVSALGTTAAGVIGGLAAGALLGAAVSEAHEAPAYGYGYDRPSPVYGYEYAPPPVVRYRPARVIREYDYDDAPVYRSPRAVRVYDGRPEGYGYRPAGYGFRRDCDRPRGYGGYGAW